MKQKLKFIALSTLIGSVLFFILGILLALIDLLLYVAVPHGFGTQNMFPMFTTPIGFVSALIISSLLKTSSFPKLLTWLTIIAVPTITSFIFFFFISL